MESATQLAGESRFRKKQVFELFFLFKRPRGIQNCNKRGCNTDSSTRFCFCKKSPTNLSGIMEGKVSFVSFTEWFVFGEVVWIYCFCLNSWFVRWGRSQRISQLSYWKLIMGCSPWCWGVRRLFLQHDWQGAWVGAILHISHQAYHGCYVVCKKVQRLLAIPTVGMQGSA